MSANFAGMLYSHTQRGTPKSDSGAKASSGGGCGPYMWARRETGRGRGAGRQALPPAGDLLTDEVVRYWMGRDQVAMWVVMDNGLETLEAERG